MESILLEERIERLPGSREESRSRKASVSEREDAPADRLLPLSLAGIFDEAFDLYKRHFTTFALITAILMLPLLVALQAVESLWLHPLAMQTNWSGGDEVAGRSFLVMLGYFFIGSPRQALPGVLSLTALILVGGAVTIVVGDIYAGRQPSVRAALRNIRSHVFRLLGGWLVAGMAFFTAAAFVLVVVTLVMGFAITAVSVASGGVLAGVLGAVFVACMIVLPYLAGTAILARFFVFLTPMLILERLPISIAPGRTAHLTGKRRFWRAWLTVTFLPLVIAGLALLMLLALDSALALLSLAPQFDFVVRVALETAIFLFFQPYWMVCLTLLYFDYRIRREAFDLLVFSADLPPSMPGAWALQRAQAAPSAPAFPQPGGMPVAPPPPVNTAIPMPAPPPILPPITPPSDSGSVPGPGSIAPDAPRREEA
ncbi:MAG TPA: hypothetical protein VFA07_05950 [Chthonomonadaceae bacterium]|nr:hypothetical protein [Chthonomonadaceae bacterium]